MTASDWAKNQPDNYGAREGSGGLIDQDCVALFGAEQFRDPATEWYKFDDQPCSLRKSFICEKY